MFSNKLDFNSFAIRDGFCNPVTQKYAMWIHMILRENSFHVWPVAVCKWLIPIARVINHQNKVSIYKLMEPCLCDRCLYVTDL